MKGIILHGGHGTRLRPLTHTGPKQLLPIANKPMSQYCIESIKETGITDIAIIIGGLGSNKVKEYYGNGENFGVNITYIEQDEPRGIAHAIRLCKEFVNNEKFLVFLGDNIIQKPIADFVDNFNKSDYDATVLLCEVDNPSRFGIADVENEKIVKITEKPKNPTSNLAVIGVYFLTPKIFDIIDNLKPSMRGELEITDALQLLMDTGNTIAYDTVTGWWKDTGTPDDIIHANRLVLDSIGTEEQFLVEKDASIKDNIIIGSNTEISQDSSIIGPAIIGKNCKIGNAVRLGPYVSIGDNCILENCNIENSILMKDCKVYAKINLSSSIIAHSCQIDGSAISKKSQFLLGERTHLKL